MYAGPWMLWGASLSPARPCASGPSHCCAERRGGGGGGGACAASDSSPGGGGRGWASWAATPPRRSSSHASEPGMGATGAELGQGDAAAAGSRPGGGGGASTLGGRKASRMAMPAALWPTACGEGLAGCLECPCGPPGAARWCAHIAASRLSGMGPGGTDAAPVHCWKWPTLSPSCAPQGCSPPDKSRGLSWLRVEPLSRDTELQRVEPCSEPASSPSEARPGAPGSSCCFSSAPRVLLLNFAFAKAGVSRSSWGPCA
mmetsp:Transcript_108811/g.318347  ORF Transcript_108811/g.318347 Transcript_108811/m.318347 type:complete len:258 (-) Transcript_108811:281-1054(-)